MKILLIMILGVMLMNTATATELKIEVNNIDVKRGGSIIVMIFCEDGFPKKHEKAVYTKSNNLLSETMEFYFNININMSELAVKVLHDENGDGKVSKNWTGIFPSEGLGFSAGQKIGLTGPPSYLKSKIQTKNLKDELIISIQYP